MGQPLWEKKISAIQKTTFFLSGMACLTNRTSPNSFSRFVFLKRKQVNNIPIFAKCTGWPLWKTLRPLTNRHFSRLEWLVNYIEHHQTLSLDLFFQKRINFKISIFWQNPWIDPFEKDQFFGHSQICTFFSSKVLCLLFRISPKTLSTPNMPPPKFQIVQFLAKKNHVLISLEPLIFFAIN